MGRMGMSRAEFLAMTPAEFDAAAREWYQAQSEADISAWRRVRRLAAIVIRPHIKKPIAEEKLIPLPGDHSPILQGKSSVVVSAPEVSAARIAAFRGRS